MRLPVRLSIVMSSMAPTGHTDLRYWSSIIAAIEGSGFRVQVLTARARRLLRPWDRQYAGRYQRNPVLVSPRLIWDVFRSRPDYILSLEYGMTTVWSLLGARLARARLLIFQENRHPAPVGLSRRRRLYRRLIGSMAYGIIANTEAAEREVLADLKIPRPKVTAITLLSPPTVEFMTQEKAAVKAPPARPLFLFVGQLIPRKNVQLLLLSAQLLRERGLQFTMWIVGDGPLADHLKHMTKAFRLEATVTFHGSLPYTSIGHIYRACDVFVMPSHVDYRSVAVLEAMRFGKPILVSESDGNAGDAVRPGFNGYIFDPRHPEQLADRMMEFIIDPDLAQRMGAYSKRLIEEQTPKRAAVQLRALLGLRM